MQQIFPNILSQGEAETQAPHLQFRVFNQIKGNAHMPRAIEQLIIQKPVRSQKRRRTILIVGSICLVNLGLLIFLVIQLLTPAPGVASDPLIGHAAPNFSLALLQSSTGKRQLSLSDFKGRPLVLNFWASWCEPCKEETPLLESRWQQLRAQGKDVVFLGIDFQETGGESNGFLQLYHVTYPTALDADGRVASSYKIVSLPDTIFINRQGIVVGKEAQQLTDQQLSQDLKLIL
jgi:cytochrome c biogenesis protein CcmG/thiol:disulfide interchange protein DsbE